MEAVKSNRYHNPDTAKKRLLYWLLVFFIGFSLPVYFLLHKVYSQLENETWYRQRNQAELLVERIERQLLEKLRPEQERPIAEYSFFNVLENPLLQTATVNFSPLSQLPPKSDIPGLIGYFQIEPKGSFHIPALPELNTNVQSGLKSGLSAEALATRIALKEKLHGLLAMNDSEERQEVVSSEQEGKKDLKEQNDASQQSQMQTKRFDDYFQLDERDQEADIGRIEAKTQAKKKSSPIVAKKKSQTLSEEKLQQLNIKTSLWKQKRKQNEARSYQQRKYQNEYRQQARKETVKIPDQSLANAMFNRSRVQQSVTESTIEERENQLEQPITGSKQVKPEPAKNQQVVVEQQPPVSILSFESEVSPLQMIRLGGQYLCFYRNAWNGKSRYIQGLIVDNSFLKMMIEPILDTTESLPLSSLLIVNNGNLLQQFKTTDVDSELLLFRRFLLPPFQQIEMIVNSRSLSAGSGKRVLDMVGIALALIIGAGFILFYRLGSGQIELAKRQSNFISSVSHELKTPLTSIRMYSEMLRSDWVEDESRKKSYYDYMYFESERLSRLISNVLQLARLDNHQEKIQPVTVNAKQLLQQIQVKVAAQIEAANFQLTLVPPMNGSTDVELQVEEDAFFQIMINLVDNAIKFSKQSKNKTIDIGYKISYRGKQLIFYVRDYGPGVEKQQMKKIFRLFYRAGDELTRTQPGTGIGLALVAQLAESMGAVVDLVNRSPGAEFQLKFEFK